MKQRYPIRLTSILRLTVPLVFLLFGCGKEPPTFHRGNTVSFAEVVAQPPSYVYGSSIHLWLYTDPDGEIQEIDVTGHADSSTCSQVSSLLFSTILQKNSEDGDLAVAGAARLVRQENRTLRERLEQNDAVQSYRGLRDRHARVEFTLQIARVIATPSKSDQSAIHQGEEEERKLRKAMDELESRPEVQQYLRQSRSGDALANMAREATRVAEETGLVQIHSLPLELVQQARERVRKATSSGNGQVISFADLARKSPDGEGAALMDMLRVRDAKPLVLTVDLGNLSAEEFRKAREANHAAVESAIVGDARDRHEFYQDKRKDNELEIQRCAELTPEEREEVVLLNQVCDSDGICRPSPDPIRTTRGQYCDIQVRINGKIVNNWIDGVKDLLQDIEEDRKRADDGKVESINHAILLDSLLRDWDLPIRAGQATFDTWRTRERKPLWRRLRSQLAKMGVEPEAIRGENVVFLVKAEAGKLIIRPLHVVDLRRSVVAVDQRVGVTQVVDAWGERELVVAASGGGHPKLGAAPSTQAAGLVQKALHDASRGAKHEAHASLARGLALDPAAASAQVEGWWLPGSRHGNSRAADLERRVGPLLKDYEVLEALRRIEEDPLIKESTFAYINALKDLVRTHPDAPPDVALGLAFLTARTVMQVEQQINATPAQGDAWDVLEAYSGENAPVIPPGILPSSPEFGATPAELTAQQIQAAGNLLTSSTLTSIPYPQGRLEVALQLYEDPLPVIRDAVDIVRRLDPDYFARAREIRGMPTQPSAQLARIDADNKELPLFEAEALEVLWAKELLRRGAAASKAALSLESTDSPDLQKVLADLDVAIAPGATAPPPMLLDGADRLREFLQADESPDTLARLQLAQRIDRGSEQLARWAASHLEDRFSFLRGLRDHILLLARVQYERGKYAEALETLYDRSTTVALYHPDLRWNPLNGDWVGHPSDLLATTDAAGVLVQAPHGGGPPRDVLRLTGLPIQAAAELASRIQEAGSRNLSGRGKVSDQILMLQVEVRPELAEVADWLLEPEQRLPLLKAMVYACTPPGKSLVPSFGRCLTDDRKADTEEQHDERRIIAVKVPSLSQIEAKAKKLLATRR